MPDTGRVRARRIRKLVLAASVVAVLAVAAHLLRDRLVPTGYSDTRGARVVHYDLQSRILGRRLAEVAVLPPGGGRRPLLVFLHGRHDPPPLRWLVGGVSGPQSVLNDSLFAALGRLGDGAPVLVALDGGAHSYFHDRHDGRWATEILREAIPDAVRRFGTNGRVAIGGISMGGYGALHLASLAPRRFCAVGGHSAALWTVPRGRPCVRRAVASCRRRCRLPRLARRARTGVLARAHDGVHALLRPCVSRLLGRRCRKTRGGDHVRMGLVLSLLIAAAGLILALAVHPVNPGSVDVNTVGWILFVVGLVGLVLDLVFWSSWTSGYFRRAQYVDDAYPPPRRTYAPRGRRTVVEEEEDVSPGAPGY